MGGLLTYFGLHEWFKSLSSVDQQKIFDCYKNETTDPNNLIEGEISYTSLSAVRFLTNLAHNALASKDHGFCDLLMAKALEIAERPEDIEYHRWLSDIIREQKVYIPDQSEIDVYKGKVLLIIKNDPGILQSRIKKLFCIGEQHVVGHAISQLTREGSLRREKKGNSFRLYL